MGVKAEWSDAAYAQMLDLMRSKPRQVTKVFEMLKEIARTQNRSEKYSPEQLTGDKAGLWSRHIDKKNRLVYSMSGEDGDIIAIVLCDGHYDDH